MTIAARTALPTGSPRGWIDTVADGLLASLLTFLPFAFGGTRDLSHEIFFVAATALMACALVKFATGRSGPFRWSWALLPIGLFLALVALQLVAWPVDLLAKFSPHTAAFRQVTLGDEPDAPSLLARQTVSLYPLVTLQSLQLVFAVSCVFVAVLQLYQGPARIERLLLFVAVIGFAVSLLAVYENATGATTIYGIVPAVHRNSGPFMHYSHFGQFMNLSIGASIGLALMRWHEQFQRVRPKFIVPSNLTSFLSRPRMRLVTFLAVAALTEAVTVVLAMSRMGIIAIIVAGAVVGALITWRSESRDKGSVTVLAGILLLAAVLVAGFDGAYNRLATLRSIQTTDGGRWQMLKDMTAEFKQSPIVGTGLGTHEFVFPMYDHSTLPERATHADNEFAQMMEETGSIGVAVILAFVAIISANFWTAVRYPARPVQYAAFGIGFGLIAILIHSCTDFGQHVPANAVLTACLSALLINIARLAPPANTASPVPADPAPVTAGFRLPRASVALFATLLVVLLGGWAVRSTDAARVATASWAVVEESSRALSDQQWQGTDDQYIALLTAAKKAADHQPGNVLYRYWLNEYRWHAICHTRSADGNYVLPPNAVGFVARIVDDLKATRPLCPTFGQPYSLEGELEHFVLNRPEGVAHVDLGATLAPADASTCLIAARLDIEAGRYDQALAAFRRAARYGGNKPEAVTLFIQTAKRPDLAYAIAAGDEPALRTLLDQIAADPAQAALASRCRADLAALLEAKTAVTPDSGESFAALAAEDARAGNSPRAISHYRKAIAFDYGQVNWHLQLADLLAKSGDTAGAIAEARVCLRLQPRMKEAETLLTDLSVRPASSVTATP